MFIPFETNFIVSQAYIFQSPKTKQAEPSSQGGILKVNIEHGMADFR